MKHILATFLICSTLGTLCMYEKEVDPMREMIESSQQYSPLLEAIKTGDISAAKKAIELDPNVNFCTITHGGPKWSPLGKAVARGKFEMVQFLLDQGADPNFKDHTSPLIQAAQNGHAAIADLLIERKACVNEVYGVTTPLLAAITQAQGREDDGYTQTIQILLNAQADLTANLQIAVARSDFWTCLHLLLLGADPAKLSDDGSNAFHWLKKEFSVNEVKISTLLCTGTLVRKAKALVSSCCMGKKKDKYE